MLQQKMLRLQTMIALLITTTATIATALSSTDHLLAYPTACDVAPVPAALPASFKI